MQTLEWHGEEVRLEGVLCHTIDGQEGGAKGDKDDVFLKRGLD